MVDESSYSVEQNSAPGSNGHRRRQYSDKKDKPENPPNVGDENSKPNKSITLEQLSVQLNSIEAELKKLQVSIPNESSADKMDFAGVNKSIDAVKSQLTDLKNSVNYITSGIPASGIATHAEVLELWTGKVGKVGGINSIQSKLDKLCKEFDSIKHGIDTINKNSDKYKDAIDAKLKDLTNSIATKEPVAAPNIDIGKLIETIETGFEEVKNDVAILRSQLSTMRNSKKVVIDDTALSAVSDSVLSSISNKVESAVSSAMRVHGRNQSSDERKRLSKEMIMIIISALILTVSTVFISYGILLRYGNGLPLGLSWAALAVYVVTLLSAVLSIALVNQYTESSDTSRIVRIVIMSVLAIATLVLSLLSLILL